MMKVDLKPCPFCGGEAKFRRIEGMYHVRCSKCKSALPEAMCSARLEIAAHDWNRQANLRKEAN